MTTLKTLMAYQKLHENVEYFLKKKCNQHLRAEHGCSKNGDCSWTLSSFKFLKNFEIHDEKIEVEFQEEYDSETTTVFLDRSILFDDDYYEQIKARYDEKMKKEDEKIREAELKLYADLKRKYEPM